MISSGMFVVVMAMDGAGLKENIFTNIDSAVIVD
jgi:hypothetical protein